MNDLFCLRCNSKQVNRYKRESVIYQCKGCGAHFRASEVRDFLLEEVRQETSKFGQQDVCNRCGRKLSEPNWCSWCGKEPYSLEDTIKGLNEQIRAVEAIIESDAVENRKIIAEIQAEDQRAREGDLQAQSHIFNRAKLKERHTVEADWKRLVDLESSVVPFLINKLDSGWQEKEAAVNALIEIGDNRAIEPLLKALDPKKNIGIDRPIFSALNTQWSAVTPRYFGQLLIKLDEILTGIQPEDEYKRGLLNNILLLLASILDHAAAEVSYTDLLAASAIKDISLVVAVETGKMIHGEDAWGHLDYPETINVTKTTDCSSLRESAQREIKRRKLE